MSLVQGHVTGGRYCIGSVGIGSESISGAQGWLMVQ
jgi:hypothetical protein